MVTVYFFLALASVSLVKSLQNAFYLGRVGFDWKLPALYVALAVISGLAVASYRHLSRHYSRVGINGATLVAMIVGLIIFVPLLGAGSQWVYTAFYLWGGLFSVLVPTLGWMLAYQLYGTRRAKRIFGLLGTGGILGGAFGGYYAAWMSRSDADPRNLLIHAAVALALMTVLMPAAARLGGSPLGGQGGQEPDKRSHESIRSTVQFILKSRYLTYLAGIVLMSAGVTTMIDLLYKRALEQRFMGSPGEITQFFGGLLGTIFIFSALFQLLATSRVVRRFGIGAGLLALPLALLGANALVLAAGAFWTVVGLKIADGCLRSSLHKTSVELLYVPVTDERTLTVKGIIDLAVFRLGDALGAGLFLGFAALPGSSLHWVALGSLLATVVWALWSRRIGTEYLKVLRTSLEVRPTPSARRALNLRERVAEKTLVEALSSDRSPKLRFALLQLVESCCRSPDETPRERYADGTELVSQGDDLVIPTFAGSSPPAQPPPWIDSVVPLLEHPEPDIAATALHILMTVEPDRYAQRLRQECSGHGIPDLVCLHYLERYGEPFYEGISTTVVTRWAKQAKDLEAEVLARLMGKLQRDEFVPILTSWAGGADRETARSALRSLGAYRDWDQVDLLIDSLNPLWSRPAARESLIRYGSALIPRLEKLLSDYQTPLEVRREIPFILARMPARPAVEALVRNLYSNDPVISYRALKGLNRVREKQGLPFGQVSFSPALQIWVREYYELLNLDILMGKDGDNAQQLARKAIRERLDRCTEKIFRGLELFLPPGDAYFSYLGFTGEVPGLKENAIELIDLRIRGELRETILPIVTGYNQGEVVKEGRRLQRLTTDLDGALAGALFLADPWLKCCIIAAARSRGRPALKERVRRAREDVNPLVRETAEWALDSWGLP